MQKIVRESPLFGGWVDKFMEKNAIMASMNEIGFKNRNFSGSKSSRSIPKTIFMDYGGQGAS